MNTKSDLESYLECEMIMLNTEFPKFKDTTADLFQKSYEFISDDFDGLSDNCVFRLFLDSFKEIICFAFERDVSKAYLRSFFKIMNNEIIIAHIGNYAKSRLNDIKNVMFVFVNSFTTSWQGYDNNKERVLEEIVKSIDSWK